jgi:hypothetical protein
VQILQYEKYTNPVLILEGCPRGKRCPYVHAKLKLGEKLVIEYREEQRRDWEKLESSPATLNTLLGYLGHTDSEYAFYDIFGFDDDLLSMVPSPCNAVVCCFPISKAMDFRENPNDVFLNPETKQNDLYFIKQTVFTTIFTSRLEIRVPISLYFIFWQIQIPTLTRVPICRNLSKRRDP